MIGIARLAPVAIGLAVVAVVLGPGSPRPEVARGARQLVVEGAARADEALAAAEAELSYALDVARSGAARVVAGGATPGATLEEAAALVRGAADEASRARDALSALERARRARTPAATALPGIPRLGDVESIATQLAGTAEAADEFAEMRTRAAEATDALGEALAALDAGDLTPAQRSIDTARAAHGAVAGWDVDMVTLPVWIETTDAMIAAVETIVDAHRRGDLTAADSAANDFFELSDRGAEADRALRIAIGEGGSAVTAAPLGRLASVLSTIVELRAAVRSVADAARP